MPERYDVQDAVLDSQHNLGGTNFNLFKLSVKSESGFVSHGVECWRPSDKDPILTGETYIAAIEDAGKGRQKFKIDWRATNAMNRGGGSPAPQAAAPATAPVQSSGNGGQPTYADNEARRQESIEFQSARSAAVQYASLMAEATGEVPSIEQVNGWTRQLHRTAA